MQKSISLFINTSETLRTIAYRQIGGWATNLVINLNLPTAVWYSEIKSHLKNQNAAAKRG